MTYCSVVTVLALIGLTKKHFGHYAILKNLSLRLPSEVASGQGKIHVNSYRRQTVHCPQGQ